ncbi:MAG: DegT/DnrJ/EryC1/StrS family aminotransferase [Armatimonadota bacterium]|nr:MAG: DegT/DnrJ/EryC1/StrS family aminotransferase [Armatimonadota bacterium]
MAKLALLGGEKTVTLHPGSWPRVGEEEIAAVVAALRRSNEDSRYLTAAGGGGPMDEFERDFAAFMGVGMAMTTSGGGPALHIAVMAAGVEAGDEVIVSGYTWGQTVSCILQQNAIPVFADIEERTYNLDAAAVESRITESTRAIVVVHIYGHPADMDAIMAVAEKHGLPVIEDCAQAIGAVYHGRRVGAIGHLGCYSIGDGKNMVGGEGGLLVTDDERLFELANLMGQHPARHGPLIKDESLRRYIDSLIYTYRIHPLAAVIANVQLRYLDEWNAQRRRNAEYLSRGLSEIPGIEPPFVAPGCEHVYHIYSPTFVADEAAGVSRQQFVEAVAAEGVPVGMGYVRTPVYLRPRHQEHAYFYGKGCPWSCHLAKRAVEYHRGDCPVTERRCDEQELTIGGSVAWLGDQTPMMDQYLDAFRKVAENLDALREVEA